MVFFFRIDSPFKLIRYALKIPANGHREKHRNPEIQKVMDEQGLIETDVINSHPVVTLDGVDDTYAFPITFNDTDYVIILVYSYIGSETFDKRLINGSNNWFLGPLNGSRHGFYNGSYNYGKGVDSAQFVVHHSLCVRGKTRVLCNDRANHRS